jgi:S1-C subfamily serine protease
MRGSGRQSALPTPSERTWIHPSELPGSFENVALPATTRTSLSRRFQVSIATSASALLVAGGLLLAAPSTQPAGATVGPHVATRVGALPAPVRAAADATMALVIYEGSHLGTATAMIVPPGDLAVTTTPIPAGASVMGLRPGQPTVVLTVVGTDRLLGVTALRFPGSAPVTPIASLQPAVATGGSPTTLTALAAVRGSVTPVEFQYAASYLNAAPTPTRVGSSLIGVTHGVSLIGVVAGSLVLDGQGRAVAASVPALGPSSFVPALFLQLLAQRIVLGNTAGHGWLQLVGAATATGSAKVGSVARNGASWGRIKPGDVLVAINSQPVRTMADVGSLLYTSSPGQPTVVSLARNGHRFDRVVHLAASP